MDIILDCIFEFILQLWTDFMEKKGRQYNFSKNKKVIKVISIIILNVLALIGAVLFIAIFFSAINLIEWLFNVQVL